MCCASVENRQQVSCKSLFSNNCVFHSTYYKGSQVSLVQQPVRQRQSSSRTNLKTRTYRILKAICSTNKGSRTILNEHTCQSQFHSSLYVFDVWNQDPWSIQDIGARSLTNLCTILHNLDTLFTAVKIKIKYTRHPLFGCKGSCLTYNEINL